MDCSNHFKSDAKSIGYNPPQLAAERLIAFFVLNPELVYG